MYFLRSFLFSVQVYVTQIQYTVKESLTYLKAFVSQNKSHFIFIFKFFWTQGNISCIKGMSFSTSWEFSSSLPRERVRPNRIQIIIYSMTNNYPRKILSIFRLVEDLRAKGEEQTLFCIELQQKLLQGVFYGLEQKLLKYPPYDISSQLMNIVGKINKKVNSAISQNQVEEQTVFLFFKAFNLVQNKYIKIHSKTKYVKSIIATTYNNLSCLLKIKGKYTYALHFINQVSALYQSLSGFQSIYDFAVTQINKAAILSLLGNHQRANIELRAAETVLQKNSLPDDPKYKSIKINLYISLGVQLQQLKLRNSSRKAFKKGLELAVETGSKPLQDIIVKNLNSLD